jgi:hypothetical protein
MLASKRYTPACRDSLQRPSVWLVIQHFLLKKYREYVSAKRYSLPPF